MAVADRYTGADVYVEFDPTGATALTQISGNYTNFSMSRTADTVDITADGEEERSFLPTKESLDWTMSAFMGLEALSTILVEGTEGVLTVYPKGKTSSLPMRQFPVIITGYNETFPFDGAVEIEVSGVRTGPMTADVGSVYTP